MVSKKFKLILALVGLIQTASFGQATDANYVYDSSKISSKNMPHYSEFTNYQTPYPAKPRSMWELGLSGGLSMIIGDIDPQGGVGGGISVRKGLGHVVSLRAGWVGSVNYGLDYRLAHTSFGTPEPWRQYEGPNGGGFVYNYRNEVHQLSLDALFSLNTVSHYRGNPKVDWYALFGYTYTYADVDVINGIKGFSEPVNFAAINYGGTRSDIKDQLKSAGIDHGLLDLSSDKYTNAPAEGGARGAVGRHDGNQLQRHGLNIGAGMAFKISNGINLGIEERVTLPFDDNFDGAWRGKSNDILTATQFRLNINMGNKSKNIEPLWWVNPYNYLYNEVATPRHMKLPPVVLPDADGDGVTDQFDMEPNTPAGCAVDSHGVSLDTDGDGVPDCRDKEKLTPQNCFPVNSDGVGTCPEPECCKNIKATTACNIGSLPSVQFKAGSATLSSTATSLLDNVAQQLQSNPDCKVKLVGYGASDKRSQQLSWDHVNAIKTYLTEQKGISESRVIFTYGQQGDGTTVDLVPTMEEGPNTVPAPHPNLSKHPQ